MCWTSREEQMHMAACPAVSAGLRATWVVSGSESLLSLNLLLCHCRRISQHQRGKERLFKSSMEALDKATASNMKTEDTVVFRTFFWNVLRFGDLCPCNIFVCRTILLCDVNQAWKRLLDLSLPSSGWFLFLLTALNSFYLCFSAFSYLKGLGVFPWRFWFLTSQFKKLDNNFPIKPSSDMAK